MDAHKHFDCPHCSAPVPASLDALEAAAAVLNCPACERYVYLAMGKLSNFQPGTRAGQGFPTGQQPTYDTGD